jgi:hypothetical protein
MLRPPPPHPHPSQSNPVDRTTPHTKNESSETPTYPKPFSEVLNNQITALVVLLFQTRRYMPGTKLLAMPFNYREIQGCKKVHVTHYNYKSNFAGQKGYPTRSQAHAISQFHFWVKVNLEGVFIDYCDSHTTRPKCIQAFCLKLILLFL